MRERVIRVKGKGTVSMPPDCIQINIKLNKTYLSYEESMKAAASSIEEIRQALKPYGFSKKDIKTNNFEIDSRYESVRDNNGNYNRVFLGYTYNHNLNIDYSWSDINIYHEDNVMYEDMDCCDSEIEAIDLEAEDLSTSDTVTVTWQII